MSEYTAMFGDWLNAFRDWSSTAGSGCTTIRESGSTSIRNLVLAAVAVAALPLAIWRSKTAARQDFIAQQDLLHGGYKKAPK